jgi:hypothetical protein
MLEQKKAQLTVVVAKMEAAFYSVWFTNVYKIVQSHILKDSNFQSFSCWFAIRDLLLRIYAIN